MRSSSTGSDSVLVTSSASPRPQRSSSSSSIFSASKDPFLNSLQSNQTVFAKPLESKQWRVAQIVRIDLNTKEVHVMYLDDPSASTSASNLSSSPYLAVLPLDGECISSCDNKRKRKFRINFDEEERAFAEAVGGRKPKKKSIESDGAGPKVAAVASSAPVVKSISKKSQSMKVNEAATESSLQEHLPILKPFLTPKIYEKIRSAPATPLSHHQISTQPRSITKAKLRDYQLAGVSWLVNQYLKSINCILADEMGLGKTLQTISYISYLTTELQIPGPHLIVVPLSVLFNWILEFRSFCPSLRILRMHSNNLQDQQKLREILTTLSRHSESANEPSSSSAAPSTSACPYDVVITTYEMVKGKLETNLARVYWRTMVLDEGHRIKNDEAQITKACLHYKARFKIVLTGTPVQNNLHETYSLLHFLHPNIFQTSETFDNAFQFSGNDIHVDQHLVDRAHYLLRLFLLRRIKTEVEQKLPPKLETVIKCPMSSMQIFWSKRLLLRESQLLEGLEEKMTGEGMSVTSKGNAWKRLQSLLAQLRKAANHPYLFPDAEDVSVVTDGSTTEEIVTASGKMMMLDRLLPHLQANGHRVVLFSQYTRTLDIIQDYLDMRGYQFTRLDGSTHRVNREVRITQFNSPTSKTFLFLLSTRAGGEGVNLYTADTVILFDSDWNPQVDIQAMARVHRIGQTKTVHIYRLVTSGTVEERIVQRAQKKLYLDSLVNRGCTSQAVALDKLRASSKASARAARRAGTGEGEGEGEGDDEEMESAESAEELSTVMSALKFGFGAIFSKETNGLEKEVTRENIISDEEISALLDRSRGLKPDHRLEEAPRIKRAASLPASASTAHAARSGRGQTPSLLRGRSDGNGDAALYGEEEQEEEQEEEEEGPLPILSRASSLTENQEESVASFHRNLSVPLVGLRYLNGEYHSRHVPTEREIQESLIIRNSKQAQQQEEEQQEEEEEEGKQEAVDLTGDEDPSPLPVSVAGEDDEEEDEMEEENGEGKSKKQRVVSKKEGNSFRSIASDWAEEKKRLELAAARNQRSVREKQTRTETVRMEGVGLVQVLKVNQYTLEGGEPSVFEREMKGRGANYAEPKRRLQSYEHQDFCQNCWDGGSLICCQYCPASYHPKCAGLKKIPSWGWTCPHHASCTGCSGRMGFSFRCESCPNAYCEDCLPTSAVILDGCDRWVELGFKIPGNCCFIQCSKDCEEWAEQQKVIEVAA